MPIIIAGNYSSFHRKLIEIAFENLWRCDGGKSRHLTFICYGKTIVCFGWNNENKSHPLAKQYNYYGAAIHSELHSLTRFPKHHFELNECDMFNIRIDRLNQIRLAKPCRRCQQLLIGFSPRRVFFTGLMGQFERLY